MLIDTHTHYNFEPIGSRWRELWELAQAKGVTHAIQIGTNLITSQEVVALAEQESHFFATVGVHPHDIGELDMEKLRQLAQSSAKVVAIGEIGLDYFRLDRTNPQTVDLIAAQKKGFVEQLQLALELQLPLSIHVRDDQDQAYQDILAIFDQHPPQTNFVLHCVSGPTFYIEEMIRRGAWFGFDGNITYKNAESLREILRLVPTDKIVVETDAPYLPPMPHRGHSCEPWMLTLTAAYLAENFGLTQDQLAANSAQLFPLSAPYQLEF